MSFVTDVFAGYADAASYRAQARASDYNSILNQQAADQALVAGNANEEAQRRRSAVEMGRVRASLAENGIGLDSGTASDLVEQSAMNAELDALNVRYGAQTQSRAYKAQSALDAMTAQTQRMNAQSSIVKGYLNAGAKALSMGAKYVPGFPGGGG